MPRILSKHGNVIAADFRPDLAVRIMGQWLYIDGQVGLYRVTTALGGEPHGKPQHFWVDFEVGSLINL